MILVTGGAGFIGANFVVDWLAPGRAALDEAVLVIDSLTYAGNLANLAAVRGHAGLLFERRDICDGPAMLELLRRHRLHLARFSSGSLNCVALLRRLVPRVVVWLPAIGNRRSVLDAVAL
jgi:dTDP-D-glucose 4,6-dehydratase